MEVKAGVFLQGNSLLLITGNHHNSTRLAFCHYQHIETLNVCIVSISNTPPTPIPRPFLYLMNNVNICIGRFRGWALKVEKFDLMKGIFCIFACQISTVTAIQCCRACNNIMIFTLVGPDVLTMKYVMLYGRSSCFLCMLWLVTSPYTKYHSVWLHWHCHNHPITLAPGNTTEYGKIC